MYRTQLDTLLGTRRRGLAAIDLLLLGALLFVLARGAGRMLTRTPDSCVQVSDTRLEPFIQWYSKSGSYFEVDSFQDPRDRFPLGIPISQIEASPSLDNWADLDDGHLQPGDVLLRADLWGTRPVVPYGWSGYGRRQPTGWTFVVERGGARHTYHLAVACDPLSAQPPLH